MDVLCMLLFLLCEKNDDFLMGLSVCPSVLCAVVPRMDVRPAVCCVQRVR